MKPDNEFKRCNKFLYNTYNINTTTKQLMIRFYLSYKKYYYIYILWYSKSKVFIF